MVSRDVEPSWGLEPQKPTVYYLYLDERVALPTYKRKTSHGITRR